MFDPWKIIKYPHLTEKSIGLVERENKLVFIVDEKATKAKIKKAVEKALEVKVVSVNILYDMKGRKKAFVKISPEYNAIDIATKLGML